VSILGKHFAFVKEQAEFHVKMVDKFGGATFRGSLHKATADKFFALADDLQSADRQLDNPVRTSATKKSGYQLSLSLEEVEDLPDELLEELHLSGADRTEFAIVNAIEEGGGIITLNRLLIALYRKTGEVYKRQSLYSILARLAQKNAIYYVPGKKGVYSLEQISAEDAWRMFGPTTEREEEEEEKADT
jgi:hypothetical protein